MLCSSQLLQDAKNWQEKHEKLSEEIKAYHKTQSELENALVHKENEIEVSWTFLPSNDFQRLNRLFNTRARAIVLWNLITVWCFWHLILTNQSQNLLADRK